MNFKVYLHPNDESFTTVFYSKEFGDIEQIEDL